jgi:hypothetical protein
MNQTGPSDLPERSCCVVLDVIKVHVKCSAVGV